MLEKCLRDLDSRIDLRQEEANLALWRNFVDDGCSSPFFTAPGRGKSPAKVPWPTVSINTAIGDVQAMLLQQLGGASQTLESGGSGLLCVRCNYGTGILPTLFGCEVFMMDEALATLPTAKPLGSRDRVLALLDAGVPDIKGGLGGKVFAAAEAFLSVFEKYPNIARCVDLYHPDVQGPIDVAELVWGSDMFYAFYEDAPLLRDLLELITQTYSKFMREWYRLVPRRGEYSVHWGMLHRGALMLRNDSLMNLSPEAYVEFARPMDQRLLDEFGGGAIHFCGRGDHFISAMAELRGLSAINLSQPHLNDMEKVYRHTVDRGIKLINLNRSAAENAGRPLRGQVHVEG